MDRGFSRPLFLGLAFLFGVVVPHLSAQSSTPQAYSLTLISNLTEVSMFSGRESNVKIYRNGSKELVEVTLAPQAGNSKSVRMRYLFDFQAHKAYTQDVINNACSWMKYVSADAPVNYDPITGSAVMLADTAKVKPQVLGTEAINGIRAKAEEFVSPGQGKSKIWLAEKGNFIVKLEGVGPDDKPIMNMEVKQLSYDKPPDALFAPPPNCTTQTQGEWSNMGVNAHAEASVEAHGSGSANLATNQTQGEATVQTSGPTGSQSSPKPERAGAGGMGATSPQASSRVTEVRLHLVPDHYAGPCPGHVQLVADITTNGPGTVWYKFLAGAVSHSPEGTVSFSAAGTQTVTIDGTFRMTPRVPHASLIAIMEDQEGRHGPQNVSSGPVDYNITCTGQASPAN
jgi:hypothetical protein